MNRRPRYWFPVAMIVAAGGLVALVATWPELPRQQRHLWTFGAIVVSGTLIFAWFIFFSRIRFRVRFYSFLALVGSIALAAGLLRFRGVTGDLLPILEFRWKKEQKFEIAGSNDNKSKSRPAAAGEFTQFYGPARNAVLTSPELKTNWLESPPEVVWKQSIGPAWSGFAIKNGFAITLEQRGNNECVTCYEVLSGRMVWMHADPVRFWNPLGGEGPRTTPTIVNNRVFTFGSTGILNCLDLFSGRLIWSRDVTRDYKAEIPEWGFASSPLVTEGMVIVNVGAPGGHSLVAFGVSDGRQIWATGDAGADYSSPVEVELLGVRQILIFNAQGVVAHSLDGRILWKHPWPGKHPHVSVPVVTGSDTVLISSGYGTGIEHVRVIRGVEGNWTSERFWKSTSLKSKFGPVLVKDDYIYGLDDGILACVDLKTGQRKWKDGRYGHGQALLVSGVLLLTSEKGTLILIDPNPQKLTEIGSFSVFEGKTWNAPALAGEYLLWRNDQEAACIKLGVENSSAKKVAVSFAKPALHR